MRTLLMLLALVGMLFAGCLEGGTEADGDAPATGSDEGTDDEMADGAQNGTEHSGYTGFDGEPDDCQKIVPPGPFDTDNPTGAVTGYETRVLDIVLAVDHSFVERHGENWTATVDFIAHMADEVYQRELQLEVNVVEVVAIPQEALNVTEDTSTSVNGEASQAIIDDTKAYFETHYADLDRDLVYTLVGTSAAGAIAGQADCIGGARFKDVSYGWGEALDINEHVLSIGPAGVGQYTSVKVILHEMAHILGAHHHYQTCGVHAAQSGPEDLLGACSIMTNAVDFASFYFSPVNKAAIRGYAEAVDL